MWLHGIVFNPESLRANETNKKKMKEKEKRGPVNFAGPGVSICALQEASLGGLFSWM